MGTWDPGYRVKRCREKEPLPARQVPAPGRTTTLLQGRQHSPISRREEVSGLEKAYVLLTVEMGSEREVRDSLKEIPEVKEVHRLYGVYDFIIRVEAETLKELKGLMNRIRDISKIRSTMPLVCIEEKRTILW